MATANLDALDALEAVASERDAADPLARFRSRFHLPRSADGTTTAYLAGNSLGAQPVGARDAVEAVLTRWRDSAVDAWFDGPDAWLDRERALAPATARLVGAEPHEITTASSLTIDLHLLLASFYRPTSRRSAILIDAPTFPSDRYAVASQLRAHGRDVESDLIVVRPRDGEATVSDDEVEATIEREADRLAVVLLAAVNFATGRWLDVARLTAAAHRAGAVAIWDLAHAAGNVPLALHDAGVDAAAWCTYKYLNGGPGAPGQLFIHERHGGDARVPRLAGWWGNEPATRFEMAERFRPPSGADGWRVSTPPILSLAPLEAALAIFDEAGMEPVRAKSVALTAFLADLVDRFVPDARIITPRAPDERGAQLSLRVADASGRRAAIARLGVVGDDRPPDILRLAPAPLYDSWHDAWRAARALAVTRP